MGTTVRYNLPLIRQDMAAKGWMNTDLAKAAGVSDMTITRFFSGERQTPRTVKKIGKALGRGVRRYLLDDLREGAA